MEAEATVKEVQMSKAQEFLFGQFVREVWADALEKAAKARFEQLVFEAKVKAVMTGVM